MTVPITSDQGRRPEPRPRPMVDARQLWAGGAATAIVAALITIVGVLASRWLLHIPILSPKQDGAYGDAHTTDLVILAAGAALAATALAHLLMLSTPRPTVFLAWIIGLATVVAVLLPFSTAAPVTEKVATAVISLVLGIAIGSLVGSVADRATRLPSRRTGNGAYGAATTTAYDSPDGLR
jgi:Family of unknown function (DUF6069)